ncbi:MAG: hypothetical protein MJ252_11105 [archaeon]|nr:hypothetical protein [archaeon]
MSNERPNLISSQEAHAPKIQLCLAFCPKSTTKEEIENKYNLSSSLDAKLNSFRNEINDYLSVPGTPLDPTKRLILYDWIQQVCASHGYTRDTYHSTCTLIDVYLSKVGTIPLQRFQLLGVTALLIASKNEEVKFLTPDRLAEMTADACTGNEIKEFEREMLKTLKWKIQFPNLAIWGNIVSKAWDNFILETRDRREIWPFFRNDNIYQNFLFKNMFLILDAIAMDYCHLTYNEKKLSTALAYLLIGLTTHCFSMQDILNGLSNFVPTQAYYLLNEVFNYFSQTKFNIQLASLRDEIEYVALFFDIIFQYNDSPFQGSSDEERLQFQTINRKNIEGLSRVWARRMEIQRNLQQGN